MLRLAARDRCLAGYPECVQLLMHGADANARGSHGKTALQLAQDFKHSPACPESRKPEYKKAIQLLRSWKASMLKSWKRKMSVSGHTVIISSPIHRPIHLPINLPINVARSHSMHTLSTLYPIWVN